MALARKDEEIRVVPWFSSVEWRQVFQDLYYPEENSDVVKLRQCALERMKMWKVRMPRLPAGIEGTIEILEVLLTDWINVYDKIENTPVLTNMYCLAIMRFINFMVSAESRTGTLYKTAAKLKIPNWVVTLRHDAAHSLNRPSLSLLRKAAEFAMDWLLKEYWEPENGLLKDYIRDEKNIEREQNKLMSNFTAILAVYDAIVQILDPVRGYTHIKDIEDVNTKDSLIFDINNYLVRKVNYVNENNSLQDLLKILAKGVRIWFKMNETLHNRYEIFLDILLNTQFMSYKIIPDGTDQPGYSLMALYSHLLNSLHKEGILAPLVKRLISITCDDKVALETKQVAKYWIACIAKSVAKSKAVQNLLGMCDEDFHFTLHQAIQEVTQTRPELQTVLILNPEIPIDPELSTPDILRTALLESQGDVDKEYLNSLALLTDTYLTEQDIEDLITLQKLLHPLEEEANLTVSTKTTIKENGVSNLKDFKHVYTLEDLSKGESEKKNISKNTAEESEEEDAEDMVCEDIEDDNPWQLATEFHDWSSCPIGFLPWQKGDLVIFSN